MQEATQSHLATSLEAISARIARLGISLGVHLDDEGTLVDLLARPAACPVSIERRSVNSTALAPPTTERRVAHLKEELRALVVLRYQLESLSVKNQGLDATRMLLNQAHRHLLDQGFKPGADGWPVQPW